MHGMTPISKKRAQNGAVGMGSFMDDTANRFSQNTGLGESGERECPSCGISSKILFFDSRCVKSYLLALDSDSLRRHLVDDHRFSYVDACSIVAKEAPLGCDSLPTLVTPSTLDKISAPSSSNSSSSKVRVNIF